MVTLIRMMIGIRCPKSAQQVVCKDDSCYNLRSRNSLAVALAIAFWSIERWQVGIQ